MLRLLFAAMSLSAAGLSMPAYAAQAPECQVLVLRPIIDDIGHHWKPGQKLPVTIARAGPDGGAFFASGGSCLPRRVAGAEAVRLVNCHIGASISGGDRLLMYGFR